LGKEPLSEEEIETLIGDADVREFLNTRSAAYRQHGFKTHPPTRAQAIALMAQDPNLIKRPIIVVGGVMMLGYDQVKLRALMGAP
jgi:arsenate reductase-like glutaredoxin family protein